MILTKFKFENYGLFSGTNEFDLSPRVKYRKTRPVILFGGKNGAGKTTFLDAIRLLLYGRRSLGVKPSQREYDEHLLARVHRNKNENTRANYSKIGLEFEHVVGGEKHMFYAERSWEVKAGDKIVERFKVTKDGDELEDMGMEHQEAFIADVVPERLSQLFFFDGEKIKGIAEDISSNAAIAEAIQSLLGLDAVLSLKSDLSVYRSRILKKSNPDEYKKLLGETEKESNKLSQELEALADKQAELQTKIEGTKNDIRNCEKALAERGGSFAGFRDENLDKANELKDSIKAEEASVRECLEGGIPFAMCPSLTRDLLEELSAEEALKVGTIASRHITEFAAKLYKESDQLKDQAIVKKLKKLIQEQKCAYCSPLLKPSDSKDGLTKHGLSNRDSHRMNVLLGETVALEVMRAKKHLRRLEKESKALHEVSRDLQKAPDEVDVKEFFDRLALLNRDLGSLEEQQIKLNERERQLTNQLALVTREGERLTDKVKAGEKDQQKLDYIKRMGPALDSYKDRLTEVKINTLQAEVTECFNRLARKSDFVKGILVDPKTFQVSVVDAHGRAIPKEDLSSGEKQIFAISMLWGLARTSGRPLPVVVDTPLGRLDSDHRTKLIENYFPNAGHQVILLSTDTEVDQGLFEKLSPSISHTYHLEYQHDEGKTAFKEEYFWRNRVSI
jgi:DNA sulfur modification protein DndD